MTENGNIHTIIALVQDKPGVLTRIAGLIRRRGKTWVGGCARFRRIPRWERGGFIAIFAWNANGCSVSIAISLQIRNFSVACLRNVTDVCYQSVKSSRWTQQNAHNGEIRCANLS